MASITKHVLPHHPAAVLPYFVRRNSRGSLPVYSDIRNGRTRIQTHIRNVLRPNALADDLARALAPTAPRLAVKVVRNRHLVLSGGSFKRDVLAWLAAKGF